jgi:hypothetical protein
VPMNCTKLIWNERKDFQNYCKKGRDIIHLRRILVTNWSTAAS